MTYNKNFILDGLSNCDFQEFSEDNSAEIEYKTKFKNCYFDGGCTKYVIVPDDTDYVIKIPYRGCFYEKPIFNDDTDECEYENYFEDFIGGVDSEEDRPWDYCAVEMNRYNIAKEIGLEKYFAKTELIGYVKGYPIYVQEKCEIFNDVSPISSKEETKRTKDRLDMLFPNGIRFNNSAWMADFAITYSFDELVKFIIFLKKNNWDEDLHGDNIGYLNGKPVLVDYSGFYEQEII